MANKIKMRSFILSCILFFACQTLHAEGQKMQPRLEACIEAYPGVDHPIKGKVRVLFNEGGMIKLKYRMTKVRHNSYGGLHIHEGKSCDTHEEVLGHYWNAHKFPVDPWNPKIWKSNRKRKAKGGFNVKSGYSKRLNNGRAVVVHDSDGNRIGCGILSNAVKNACFRN